MSNDSITVKKNSTNKVFTQKNLKIHKKNFFFQKILITGQVRSDCLSFLSLF